MDLIDIVNTVDNDISWRHVMMNVMSNWMDDCTILEKASPENIKRMIDFFISKGVDKQDILNESYYNALFPVINLFLSDDTLKKQVNWTKTWDAHIHFLMNEADVDDVINMESTIQRMLIWGFEFNIHLLDRFLYYAAASNYKKRSELSIKIVECYVESGYVEWSECARHVKKGFTFKHEMMSQPGYNNLLQHLSTGSCDEQPKKKQRIC
jgi:hypothetical protein